MKKLILYLLSIVCLCTEALADSTFVVSGITYKISDDNTVNVTSQKEELIANSLNDSILAIPGHVKYGGKKYIVRTIEEEAFTKICNFKRVIIGEGVQEIKDCAFAGCANLEAIDIPASISGIGKDVLSLCINLTSVNVDKGNKFFDSREHSNAIIRKSDNTLLYGCKSTKIPSSVENINSKAFHGCMLEEVIIPEGVRNISHEAFSHCYNLKKVFISSSVEKIRYNSFHECYNLTSISVNERNKTYDSRDNCNAIIDKDNEMLLYGCSTTQIPSSIEEIGESAFLDCFNLHSITIPEGITGINDCAFRGCSALRHVSLPSSLEYFSGHANFGDCVSLDSITLPQNVGKIPNDIFMGCTSLQSIVVDPMNKTYDSRNGCNAVIKTSNDELAAGCKGTVIVDGIKFISEYSFCKSGITSINIPASVMKIEPEAFRGNKECIAITVDKESPYYKSEGANAVIEKSTGKMVLACSSTRNFPGVTSIGSYAFINSPTTLILPSGITAIEDEAFFNCTELQTVIIPATVKRIGDFAFAGCKQLTNLIIMGNDVEIGNKAFAAYNNLPTNATYNK